MLTEQATLLLTALTDGLEKVRSILDDLATDGSLHAFELSLNNWIAAFLYYRDQEEALLTPLVQQKIDPSCSSCKLIDAQVLSNNHRLRVLERQEELGEAVMESIQDILDMIRDEIGGTGLILRTKQHLQVRVMRLRTCLADYTDIVEAIIFPLMLPEKNQKQSHMKSGFLWDEKAEDKSWVIEWMRGNLNCRRGLWLESVLHESQVLFNQHG